MNSKIEKNAKNKTKKIKKFHLQHWQIISLYLMVYDIIAVNAAYFLALWIRYDCKFFDIPEKIFSAYISFMPIYTAASLVVFLLLNMYRSIWRFASYIELGRVIISSIVTGLIHAFGISLLFARMPIIYYIFGVLIQFVLIIGVRFSYRFILLERGRREKEKTNKAIYNVMLIGAGSAGRMLLHDVNISRKDEDRIACIIDDNKNKWGRFIDNVPVVGGRDDILVNVKKYSIKKIYLAMPSAKSENKRDILNICKETGCELKTLPERYMLSDMSVGKRHLQEVQIEDLLGREQIRVDMNEIFDFIRGKVILVTGGGGSIGSELCRQIATHSPKTLIIFDIYENNAYDIEQELREDHPELDLKVLIGSVRDSGRINSVFKEYKPQVVYHAAAHKHVPLMEVSPNEAIKNNVVGTYKTAYAAVHNGCERFVLISTDKAVNPTNVMGASKRLCEMIVQGFDKMVKQKKCAEIPNIRLRDAGDDFQEFSKEAKTEFVAVRFGNVLGSNGSVIPLFKKQILRGGPVKVTHPDIVRYFMTIPEAVSLVLQAGTYAKGGEIFILDMGLPVKIDSLARNLISLSGLIPDVDIKIEYVGLRPGEKLYEEKLMAEEGIRKTQNDLIHIAKPMDIDVEDLFEKISVLMDIAYNNNDDIRQKIMEAVPTFKPFYGQGHIENIESREKKLEA